MLWLTYLSVANTSGSGGKASSIDECVGWRIRSGKIGTLGKYYARSFRLVALMFARLGADDCPRRAPIVESPCVPVVFPHIGGCTRLPSRSIVDVTSIFSQICCNAK